MIVIIALLAVLGLLFIVSALTNKPPLQVLKSWTKQ